jgi:divalent metal cation (Fe/Co/Zn/Cd) transporter
VIELKSFSVALKEFRKSSHGRLVKALRDSTDTNIFVILVEDFSALAGLTIVLISSLLSLINPIFDVIGTILVGCLLITMSYFLANELRKLMIGENISRVMRTDVRSIVNRHRAVRHINNIRSMYIGNNNFILLITVDIEDKTNASSIESITEQVKGDITALYPHAKYIYLEIEEQ